MARLKAKNTEENDAFLLYSIIRKQYKYPKKLQGTVVSDKGGNQYYGTTNLLQRGCILQTIKGRRFARRKFKYLDTKEFIIKVCDSKARLEGFQYVVVKYNNE